MQLHVLTTAHQLSLTFDVFVLFPIRYSSRLSLIALQQNNHRIHSFESQMTSDLALHPAILWNAVSAGLECTVPHKA